MGAGSGSPGDGGRRLEHEDAVRQYPSLTAHVAAERIRAPAVVAWFAIVAFCSLHLLVPAFCFAAISWAVLCYRGAHLVVAVEAAVAAAAAWLESIEPLLPSSLQNGVRLAASSSASVANSSIYVAGRLAVSCPAPDQQAVFQNTEPTGWWASLLFTSTGESLVCQLCEWADPGLIITGIATAAVLSLSWSATEWPAFARFFELWYDTFNFRVIIDQSAIDPNRRAVVACWPHGIIPLGSFMTVSFFRKFLPKLDPKIGVASVLFRMPFLRQLFFWLGCVPASRAVLEEVLSQPAGKVALMPGGIAEIFLSSRQREQIFLKQRKGFVRLALETGADIIPIYVFGQTALFDQAATSNSWLMRLSRAVSASVTLFWGRGYLPIPFSATCVCVVGDPIPTNHLPGNSPPTDAEVDAVHAKVCSAVKQLFNAHKDVVGYSELELELI